MTKREAAIVSAYTGYLIGEFSDFHAYAEEIMGRPVFTHELPSIAEELKYKSKKDFMSIKIEDDKPPEWLYHTSKACYGDVDFDVIEKALGFRLFGWQKDYIITGCAYASRRTGKTTAEILHQLLSVDEEPIDFSKSAPIKRIAIIRQYYRDIWEKLHDAGIPMRPVFWSKEDKKKYDAEHYDPYKYARTLLDEYEKEDWPDCNNCKHLEFTEDDQKFFNKMCGGGYRGDHGHFCEYYVRSVYHRANSARHDSYIYPCGECYKDNFVNYYDHESSKKGELNGN